jgi:hypothetical protein
VFSLIGLETLKREGVCLTEHFRYISGSEKGRLLTGTLQYFVRLEIVESAYSKLSLNRFCGTFKTHFCSEPDLSQFICFSNAFVVNNSRITRSVMSRHQRVFGQQWWLQYERYMY